MRKLRVAVIGCGSAGPAAATLLARQGHEVTLYERAPECRPVGAGFILQPAAMPVLEELGILEAVAAQGSEIRRLHATDKRRGRLLDLRYSDLAPARNALGLRRTVLLQALLSAADQAGVRMRWGWEAQTLQQGDGWSEVTSTQGESTGRCDLLVIADGTRSRLRKQAGFHGRDRGYPWGAYLFVGEDGGRFSSDELYQVLEGAGKLLCFVPTGPDPSSGKLLYSMFWSVRLTDDARNRARPLQEWKEKALALIPEADGFLSHIHDWSQVITGRYGDVQMSSWHRDGIVILGDAAHAMSPQLGQGINLALADAACLARCVGRLPLDEALPRYTRERWLALNYYQHATRWLTPLFQSDLEWLSPWRSLAFGLSHRIGPLRRLMIRSMAGGILAAD